MDSKQVSRAIRAEIRPLLREAGFSEFSTRSAWRFSGAKVDVVNFQSLGTYIASVIGCTAHSFGVNLGCFFTDVPLLYSNTAIRHKDGHCLPEESQCHFRGQLAKGIRQPELQRNDIWCVDREGQNIQEVLEDVHSKLEYEAFCWFQRLENLSEVLRVLIEDDSLMLGDIESKVSLWGFGNNPSPIRHYLTGYFALKNGRLELSERHLRAALKSGCFDHIANQIRIDIAKASKN